MTVENAEKQTIQFMKKEDDSKGYALHILRKNDDGGTSLIDISTLVGDIQHSTSFIDNPGKLTFFIQRDPKGVLNTVRNGDMVMFKKDGVGIFKGYIFTIGMDATNVFKITAYDQLRYLKNEDNYVISKKDNKTVSQIFAEICNKYQLKYEIVSPIDFVPPPKIYAGKTLYAILKDCIHKAENAAADEKNAQRYMIRDNYGTLELIGVDKLLTNVVIGTESLLSSYQFETSIDKKTYTQIKIVKKVNVEGEKQEGKKSVSKEIVYKLPDDSAQKAWGILQKVVQLDENMNEAQAREKAGQFLKQYCRETKSLKLSAIGVMGFNAGVGFKFNVPDLGAQLNMYILSATHKYMDSFHTMDLEVNADDVEVYFK